MPNQDEIFMARCLELAKMGAYTAAPNPMVGSVIVHGGKIIGEGFHHHAGAPHAEVNAIKSVKDQSLLQKSTIYVSLEPCSHHGRTPPCSDLIVAKQIPKVVIATRDYHSAVNGQGIKKLKSAGIEVQEGLLEFEAQALNKAFFTFHRKKRPFISLKWAQSSDGIIDPERSSEHQGVQWISAPQSKVFSHQLRALHQGIVIGRRTVTIDNPSLDTRSFKGRDPLRIILDPKKKLTMSARVFRDSHYQRFCANPEGENDILIDSSQALIPQVLEKCYEMGILSILVEGGAKTLQSFIELDLWDEAFVIQSPQKLNSGLSAPKLPLAAFRTVNFGSDLIKFYRA